MDYNFFESIICDFFNLVAENHKDLIEFTREEEKERQDLYNKIDIMLEEFNKIKALFKDNNKIQFKNDKNEIENLMFRADLNKIRIKSDKNVLEDIANELLTLEY